MKKETTSQMKQLKDYLHFYLGCKVEWNGLKDGRFFLDGINDGIVVLKQTNNSAAKIISQFEDIKPILRPLTDIISSELEERNEADRTSDTAMVSNALTTKYLLSKHFDLFGLIDAGLAIDKTKIKKTE